MRRCRVIMRKVEGTDWPPAVVDHRGEAITLEGVFRGAGMSIDLERVEPDLRPLPSGRPFEPTDLRAVTDRTLAAVATPGDEWVAAALIVPEILDRQAGRGRLPLGVMFGGEHGARRAIAVAERRLRATPAGFLRTLIHELGHVFNLGHPGEDPEPFGLDALNSLMVPTDRLRPPGSIEFRFATAHVRWLSQAPDPFVRPGGLPFGSRPEGWAGGPSPGRSR